MDKITNQVLLKEFYVKVQKFLQDIQGDSCIVMPVIVGEQVQSLKMYFHRHGVFYVEVELVARNCNELRVKDLILKTISISPELAFESFLKLVNIESQITI